MHTDIPRIATPVANLVLSTAAPPTRVTGQSDSVLGPSEATSFRST